MYSSGLKLLHFLEPELAHFIAIKFLKFSRRKKFRFESDRLKTEVAGLNLGHPLGLSGGFDKNGEIIQACFNFGASFTEIGAITPLPQKGNQKPRVFRLWEDLGLINRLGFNNHGIDAVQKRMSEARPLGIVGINIGANRNSDEGKLDFEGFLSPAVIKKYAEYMHKNRFLENGQMRDSDNWQKGIPVPAYMKSMYRHFFDTWSNYRGIETPETQVQNLCGLMFNTMGMLHELLKAEKND